MPSLTLEDVVRFSPFVARSLSAMHPGEDARACLAHFERIVEETFPREAMEAEAAAAAWEGPAARIVAVEPESPADDAGFTPGCYLTTVDGEPLRDIIDWRWLAADDVICVGYIDLDGEAGVNIAKAIRPAQLSREIYSYLSPRRKVSYYFDAGVPENKGSGR